MEQVRTSLSLRSLVSSCDVCLTLYRPIPLHVCTMVLVYWNSQLVSLGIAAPCPLLSKNAIDILCPTRKS